MIRRFKNRRGKIEIDFIMYFDIIYQEKGKINQSERVPEDSMLEKIFSRHVFQGLSFCNFLNERR